MTQLYSLPESISARNTLYSLPESISARNTEYHRSTVTMIRAGRSGVWIREGARNFI